MKESIIILGAGVMQGPAINIAKELGYYTIVLDGSSSAPCISLADRFEQIDLKDKEGIETFARKVQSATNRLGIMTAGTDFSASVAWVAEKLGLPGIPYEAALNASDKSRMRECFKKASLPSPEFFIITPDSPFLIPNSTLPLRFPLVIKPVDNMGSRGCRRVDSIDEFYEAVMTALNFSRSGRVIAEHFMEGPEFSVDAIVYHGEVTICGLADRHIFFPPFFIEMGHTMPAVIDEEKQQALLDTFRAGINALGLDGKDSIGAAKGDIKLTANGSSRAMIGEIAARLSGGYMSGWTYPYSSGVLPVKAAILAAMGREPLELKPLKKWTCAERAFISIPGTIKEIVKSRIEESGIKNAGITGNEQLTENYVNDFFLRVKEGDKVSFPENNVTKCGNIIVSAPDRETAIAAAETAARSILIKLDPKDIGTKEFLAEMQGRNEKQKFPPDAFELTDELRDALKKLPETIPNSPLPNHHSPLPTPRIIPFAEFQSSNAKDYMGRSINDAIEAVRLLTGLSLPITTENAENIVRLGRSFWASLIRGSYQGAVYYIDTLGEK
ncbi:MAG: ATP-grasp domain-containing protein [Treponema sp.]|nr:ATP-grasp domain-containing protein [Treponema sp.]